MEIFFGVFWFVDSSPGAQTFGLTVAASVSRVDTLGKAKGLAIFADEHGEEFGRLFIARKRGEQWQLADMNDKPTREKT